MTKIIKLLFRNVQNNRPNKIFVLRRKAITIALLLYIKSVIQNELSMLYVGILWMVL